MRPSVQRVRELFFTETLLGVARTIQELPGYIAAELRSEVIATAMRLFTVKLGFSESNQESGYQFIFKGTRFSGAFKAFKQLDPLVEKLFDSTLPPDKSRLDRAIFLTTLYEGTLIYDFEEIDSKIQIVDLSHGKKRMGQFYTPLPLARKTVANSFNHLLNKKKKRSIEQLSKLKVLDPAMGGGVFLLCSLEYLEHYCGKLDDAKTSTRLTEALYGTDLDSLACDVAPLALWLYCASHAKTQTRDISEFAKNFRRADALMSGWTASSGTTNSAREEKIFYWDSEFPEVFAASTTAIASSADKDNTEVPSEALEKKAPGGDPADDRGFDIIVSNPPWEIAKPNSQEFFSISSPGFRKLTKQEALLHSSRVLADQKQLKKSWQKEKTSYQTKSNFIRSVKGTGAASKTAGTLRNKFGTRSTGKVKASASHEVAEQLVHTSIGAPGQLRPLFAAQGDSDLNVYKLFLDLGFALLKTNGCMTMLVPSGLLTDKGALELRRLFLSQGKLHTIETFINSDRMFTIHPSFAYSLIGVQKGGETSEITVKFDQQSNSRFGYQKKDISILSPKWLTIFDVAHPRDLEILKKLHSNGVPLGGSEFSPQGAAHAANDKGAWHLKFKREYDMTNDSRLFINVHDAEKDDFKVDIFGNWLKGAWKGHQHQDSDSFTPGLIPSADGTSVIEIEAIKNVLLPLYEGRMIGQFDYSQKSHLTGSGRTALWHHTAERYPEKDETNFLQQLISTSKSVRPHYLVPFGAKGTNVGNEDLKTGYLAVGSATNVRTMLASVLYMVPCGNSVPTLTSAQPTKQSLALTACLNSFVFDYALRMRMTGNNLNYFLLQECPLPGLDLITATDEIINLTAALNLNHVRNSAQWLELDGESSAQDPKIKKHLFAASKTDRLRMRSMLDALVAHAYGLTLEDYAWILRGCDLPASQYSSRAVPPYAKGFWREGKLHQPASRLTVLALGAYKRLLEKGKTDFLAELVRLNQNAIDEQSKINLLILSTNLRDTLTRRA